MPAARAASAREAPSSTSAKASIRRAARASRHRPASRRRPPASSSRRVIATVIAPPPIGHTADQRPRAARGATDPTVRSRGRWYHSMSTDSPSLRRCQVRPSRRSCSCPPGPLRPTHSREPGGTSTTGPSSAVPSSSPRSGASGGGWPPPKVWTSSPSPPTQTVLPSTVWQLVPPEPTQLTLPFTDRQVSEPADAAPQRKVTARTAAGSRRVAFGMTSLLTSGISARGRSRPPGGTGRSREDLAQDLLVGGGGRAGGEVDAAGVGDRRQAAAGGAGRDRLVGRRAGPEAEVDPGDDLGADQRPAAGLRRRGRGGALPGQRAGPERPVDADRDGRLRDPAAEAGPGRRSEPVHRRQPRAQAADLLRRGRGRGQEGERQEGKGGTWHGTLLSLGRAARPRPQAGPEVRAAHGETVTTCWSACEPNPIAALWLPPP